MESSEQSRMQEPGAHIAEWAQTRRTSRLVFASAVFVGAFLLFQIQPLIGKAILPWFGGTPSVWTVSMLFFQVLLFGGYVYAHLLSSRWPLRLQAVVHTVLIAVVVLSFRVLPDADWRPRVDEPPALQIILVLAASVGLPYFLLATTGPLLQRWFSLVQPGPSPYRLYALSNAGSLIALLSYPFVFESQLALASQARWWSIGFWAFAILCSWCGVLLWNASAGVDVRASPRIDGAATTTRPTVRRFCLWFVLAMLASTMYLATTNQLCQDVAVVPFLWVVPLSLYLLSFILSFESDRWYHRSFWAFATGGLVVAACGVLSFGKNLPLPVQGTVYLAMMFSVCMTCHGELALRRPVPQHLTAFYLTLSAGGAGGGAFVALVAPLVFADYWEFHLSLLAAALCAAWVAGDASIQASIRTPAAANELAEDRDRATPRERRQGPGQRREQGRGRGRSSRHAVRRAETAPTDGAVALPAIPPILPAVLGGLAVVIVGVGMMESVIDARNSVAMVRNFYGVLEVERDAAVNAMVLRHGQIVHGLQRLDPGEELTPTTYYERRSGVGRAMELLQSRNESLRVGVVGLGVGTLAAYGRPGDLLRFYEINDEVDRLARTCFTFLNRTRARVETVLGDARLSLASEPPQQYDLLVLDAFSGDAIPTHLLTREAFAEYLRHLTPEGIIAIHISNLHFDLRPVVDAIADEYGLTSIAIIVPEILKPIEPGSEWVLLAREAPVLDAAILREAAAPA
ncbi:MAG: fused MFS/spermidine synthase, partial [Planctomycetaceae bacterium]|nr:fused MFS/spermidine synthase [Planctomycetaceae bacterium]